MTKHDNIFAELRHERLFELIRQNNLGCADDGNHAPKSLDMMQMQRILKRANRSFGVDIDTAENSRR